MMLVCRMEHSHACGTKIMTKKVYIRQKLPKETAVIILNIPVLFSEVLDESNIRKEGLSYIWVCCSTPSFELPTSLQLYWQIIVKKAFQMLIRAHMLWSNCASHYYTANKSLVALPVTISIFYQWHFIIHGPLLCLSVILIPTPTHS